MLNFDQNVLIRIVGELRKSVQRLSTLAGIMEDQFVADMVVKLEIDILLR